MRLFRALACALFALCLRVPAQQSATSAEKSPHTTPAADQILSSYEGQNVSSVQIAGHPELSSSQYSSLMSQQAGQPFSKAKIDQTAAALKATGKFEDVRVVAEPEANGVQVLFILEPAIYFGIFEFSGSGSFSYSQLLQIANYPIQTPFNAADVEQGRQRLVTFFEQEGYFHAAVQPEIKIDSVHEIANVIFHVTLGRKAKFGNIDLQGAPPDEDPLLRHELTTFLASFHGARIRPGKTYHHSVLAKATSYLTTILQKQGRLGAQVKLAGAEYIAATNRADIHFSIVPGNVTHVQIAGAHLHSWTRKSVLPIYQGIGVDEESVQEGQQALLSYFQAKGFFDVKVESQYQKDQGFDTVVYRITKEKKRKVTAVNLTGNTHLPSSQLIPALAVEKKHFFSPGKFSDQLVRTSVNRLKAIYQSEGFSDAQVIPTVTNKTEDIRVSFRVVEGERDIVNSLTIEGADTFPEAQFAPGGLKVVAGQPYSQAHVEADRATIVSHYLQAGYLNSSFRETAAEVSKNDRHRINVVYHIYEGPKVITGDLLTLGRVHTRQRLIDEDIASIKPGQPLTETELLTSGSRLYDHTGVFDWAEVDPKRDITTQSKEDVLVKTHEAKRNDFTYGFGFEVINRGGSIPSGTVALPNLPPIGLPSNFTTSQSTYYGPRGTVQYTRNNMRGKGESLSLTGFAGRLDQRFAAYYIDPNFRWSPWKATTSFSSERNEENPIFSAQVEQGSLQLQRPLGQAKKDIFFARYIFSQTDLTRVLIPALVPTEDLHVRLSGLAANLTRDTRDNALDEHKGVLDSIELNFNSTKLGSSVDFAKLTMQAAYYKEKLHHIVWAESVRIGIARPFENSFVPLSEAYFSGGGNSLRGFPLDGAGPQRPVEICSSGQTSGCPYILVPTGGNEMFILNSEARIPLPFRKGLSVVPFYDGGNVYPTAGTYHFASLYSNTIGLGLRYSTPVGPIRVDIGRNLNPAKGINVIPGNPSATPVNAFNATQYFISIGQAF
jgi:outer membrane protein assembly factor BamA